MERYSGWSPDELASVEADCRLALAKARTPGIVVGFSAAALWGMPVPATRAAAVLSGVVSLTRFGGGNASRQHGTDGHEIYVPPEHRLNLRGVCVTSAARTWVDCASLVSEDHLLAMGDYCMQEGVISIEEVESVLAWSRGRRGVRRARSVAPWLRSGSESPQESRLRWFMVSCGLPEPRVNWSVVIGGEIVCRLDLAYPLLKIGAEYDGDWHAETVEHDEERRKLLRHEGWEVLVVRKEDLRNPHAIVSRLRQVRNERMLRNSARW